MDSESKYNILFSNPEDKIKAFDAIAEKFYDCNFGTCSKSEMDILMFSLYIDQILKADNTNFNAYSDYTLSKQLGITQAQVSSLKVKKELKYPYKDFDWKKSFAMIMNNAWYEDNSIKLHIPDKNLYIEIKNAIEEKGGYVDVQLNRNLLKVPISCFLDLMIDIEAPSDRDRIVEQIREKLRENKKLDDKINRKDFRDIFEESGPELVADIFESIVPMFGKPVGDVFRIVIELLRNRKDS
ncbi:hypothetical protein SAMN02910456_01115 [Ruminococcaceae bacterium YRB3002]|nr:hypothetical protein SAMN02910456_01115 [Ruminococcaceae bacterium YRB3002]